MKIKQKQTARRQSRLRAKKSFKYQASLLLFFVAFCLFAGKAQAQVLAEIKKWDVVIYKVAYNPVGTDNKSEEESSYEIVELKNISANDVDISKWEIRIGAYFLLSKITTPIPPNGRVIILGGIGTDKNLDFSAGKDALIYRNKTGSQLGDSKGEIALYNSATNSRDTIVDYVAYGEGFDFDDSVSFLHAKSQGLWKENDVVDLLEAGCSMALTEKKFLDARDWKSSCPVKEDEPVLSIKYSDKLQITELFPNPFQSQYEEYIELFNGGAGDIDLLGWALHDGSKTGKYIFAQSVILKAQEYLAVFKKDFKFALNNSGNESVTLFDPNNTEVSKVEYIGSKRNVSYNFDGARWRWSKFLTPGSVNILNNEPFGRVKIDKDIFAGAYADFSVSAGDLDGEKVKVVWDFGDKHKSYLAKTRHKYEKEGTYDVSVKLSDGSEDVLKNFAIEVKKFPHPKVKIIAINANPKGADTKVETLTIENRSKKKINLKGWSIATGWKKFINHPIREDFIIAKGQAKEITSVFSSFSLNNTKAEIHLRYPDGKVAHEVKYESPNKTIADGEVYQKIKGGWEWVGGVESQEHKKSVRPIKQIDLDISPLVISNQSLNAETEEIIVPVAIERENKLLVNNNDLIKIELLKSQPQVLGAETVREIGGSYRFTLQNNKQEHYAIIFFKNIASSFNLKLNAIINYFSN